MRILSYVKSMDGCSYHRIYQQNNHTDHEVRTVSNISEADLEWCDVLNYSRHCLYAPEFLDEMRKKHNFKIVVDTDDCWIVPAWHPHYEYWKNGVLSAQISNHLKNADAVTVTHQRLKHLVEHWKINDNVIILPNTLPYGEGQYVKPAFAKSDKTRLLYASSPMNYINTKILTRVMKKISHLPIEVIILGANNGKYFQEACKNLTDNGRIPSRVYPWMSVDNYMSVYEGDIMLLPCADSEFMSLKSNMKLLEAAVCRMPVVVSKVDPYMGFPVNYANGEKEWVEQIERLVKEPFWRHTCGKSLYDHCNEYFNMNNRKHIYELI